MKSRLAKASGSSTLQEAKRDGHAKRPPNFACPIVGIGASAGGLEAFTQLLKRLPVDTGFGFVLVQHLDPQHDSMLAQLLARNTSMPVAEATDNLRVTPNHVYVISPNTSLSIERGVLKLRPPSSNRLAARSIDFFFEALAKDRRQRAIGVVLSGTATDGTQGLEAIKAAGGLTFAQDNSARFESMPRSAIAAGCVDLVLSPVNIAREIGRIAKHPYVAGGGWSTPKSGRGRLGTRSNKTNTNGVVPRFGKVPEPTDRKDQASYEKILLLLRNECGVDFSMYKPATIYRRIMRRTVLGRQETMKKYAQSLVGHDRELDLLCSDALIGVTSFFRNPEAFDVLKRRVFAKLIERRSKEPARIWVPGCSTGQEAYSLAMAFMELAEKKHGGRKLQVFATDLNETNLTKARRGFYPKSIAQDVNPERLKKFFVEEEKGYRVIKSLRELVVFARQNVLTDPPFSRMHLISCRNLMIYVEPGLQKKLVAAFHYALNPGGFLFLGASESIGGFTALFDPVDRDQKIFVSKVSSSVLPHSPAEKTEGRRPLRRKLQRTVISSRQLPLGDLPVGDIDRTAEREADRITVSRFAPPGVLIDANLQVFQFRGATSAYLHPPTGKASFDLLKMLQGDLMLPVSAIINRAKKENAVVRKENVPCRGEGNDRFVNIEVVPLKNPNRPCFLVMFEDAAKPGVVGKIGAHAESRSVAVESPALFRGKDKRNRIAELESTLADTRDYLSSVQEEQEGANEALQASNEEGQSANEELQSLNEELETSKEELEATNQELTTFNEEMANRNAQLINLNNDLTNIQTSTKLVILLLARDLTIRRFSVQAGLQFSLREGDVGRPIHGMRHDLQISNLEDTITEVIASGQKLERQVQDRKGHWYSLHVRPYLTANNSVDGAVLVLVDIDELKKRKQLAIEAREHAETIVRTVPTPLAVLCPGLLLQSANDAFFRTFKLSPEKAIGRSIFDLDEGAWNIPALRARLEAIIPRNGFFTNFAVAHDFERIGRHDLLINARVLQEPDGKPKEVILGIQDVTKVLAFQAGLRSSELRYRRLFEASRDGILILDPQDGRITDANPFIAKLLGYSRKQLLKKELWQTGPVGDKAASQLALDRLKANRFIRYENLPLESKNGRRHEVEFVSNIYTEDGRDIIQCNIHDIHERKRSEEALRVARAKLSEHAGQLEILVASRTVELTMTNRRLEASVQSIRKEQEKSRVLFEDSQILQKKLRQLTHQIITAQEAERKEISRELHDDVVQTLVGINVELAALGKGASPGGRHLKEKIAHTQRLVQTSVNAVHRFARDLRPAVLDDLGLIPALHSFSKNLAARKKLDIQLTIYGGVAALGGGERTALFRVAQEALTNVARHAGASMAKLTITKIAGAIRMEISDNGKSFSIKKTLLAKNNKRLGLIGMRERIEMVGGTLAIESAPGKGTTVRTEIPFREVAKK